MRTRTNDLCFRTFVLADAPPLIPCQRQSGVSKQQFSSLMTAARSDGLQESRLHVMAANKIVKQASASDQEGDVSEAQCSVQ